MEDCRRMAFKNGLNAKFVIGDEYLLSDGHKDMISEYGVNTDVYVVYDTDAYSYESILKLIADNHNNMVKLGIYNNRNHTVITENDVLK